MPTLTIADADDGDLTANTANIETPVFEFTNTTDSVYEIGVGTEPAQFTLMTHDAFTGDGSAVQFSLNDDLVDTPYLDDTDGNVVAFVDGSKVAVDSVSFANDTVTLDSAPANNADVDIFYTAIPGSVTLEVLNNERGGREDPVYDDSLRILHQQDQFRSPPSISRAWVGPDMVVRLTVDSSVVIATDDSGQDGATPLSNEVRIPYRRHAGDDETMAKVQDYIESMG